MRRAMLIPLLLLALTVPAFGASDVGVFQRADCTTLTAPATGKTFCFDQTANILKRYNGSAWEPIGGGIPSYTYASLPAAGVAGRLARVTDNLRGVWRDDGTRWASITGVADITDFGGSPSATAAANSTAFAAAATALNALGSGVLALGAGTYSLNDEWFIDYMRFTVQGVRGHLGTGSGTVLKYAGAVNTAKSVVRVRGGYGLAIDNVWLDADDKAGFGLRLEGGGGTLPSILSFSSTNLSISNATVAGLYLGESVGGTADPMVESLVFTNYTSYDNVIGVEVNSNNTSSVMFLGGTMGSPHSDATNKCVYHVYIDKAYNVIFYGTQFTALNSSTGVRAIHSVSGPVQVYGGYNEASPFLKVVDGGNLTTVLNGVYFPATASATEYDVDYDGPGISLEGVRSHTGKMIVRAGTLSMVGSDIQHVVNNGELENDENILVDPYLSLVPGTGTYWLITAATAAAETTIRQVGTHSIKVTADGVNGLVYQDIPVAAGDRYAYLRGKIVTFGAWVQAASTNNRDQKLGVSDGVSSFASNAIPKDDAWHYVTVTGPIDLTSTNVRVGVQASQAVSDTDDVIYVNAAALRLGYARAPLLLGPDQRAEQAAWDPGSIGDGDQETKTITVTGAALYDFVLVSFSIDTAGLQLTAQVTAANTVTAILANHTGAPVDLNPGIIRVRVVK